jgi:hypothetical protein
MATAQILKQVGQGLSDRGPALSTFAQNDMSRDETALRSRTSRLSSLSLQDDDDNQSVGRLTHPFHVDTTKRFATSSSFSNTRTSSYTAPTFCMTPHQVNQTLERGFGSTNRTPIPVLSSPTTSMHDGIMESWRRNTPQASISFRDPTFNAPDVPYSCCVD